MVIRLCHGLSLLSQLDIWINKMTEKTLTEIVTELMQEARRCCPDDYLTSKRVFTDELVSNGHSKSAIELIIKVIELVYTFSLVVTLT